jgi:non-ribosomal peptide synthetase component F
MALTRFTSTRAFRTCPSFRVAAIGLVVAASGCTTAGEYLVERDSLVAARAAASRTDADAVAPATRTSDGKRVMLRTSAIVAEAPEGESRVRVRAEAPAPLVTAGSILTWIGSGISIAASGWFFFGPRATDGVSDPTHLAAGILAAAAEPIMITGTALWIVGTMRPAQQARGGGVALTGVQFGGGSDGSRVASLRFRF